MRPLSKSFAYIVFCALALGLPGGILAQDGQQARVQVSAANQAADATPSAAENIASSQLPDSPGTLWAKAQDATPQQNTAQSGMPSSNEPGSSLATAGQDQAQRPQRPVGTAAAEAPTVNGVTAAEPAGVAIAPAKQHRVRTIVLKVGAMVGAGVALGTVIALTEATPSKPPGAH
jgi:hypothetical protein